MAINSACEPTGALINIADGTPHPASILSIGGALAPRAWSPAVNRPSGPTDVGRSGCDHSKEHEQ